MSFPKSLVLVALAIFLAGCNRDPETVKRRYLETGNKYLEQGKLKEASIMYRNALKKDQKYGEAYWKLGETELRRGEVAEAARALRRAIELLPNNPEPASKLADIYLTAYTQQREKDKRLLSETGEIADTLLKRDPNSFYGLRLKGFLASVSGNVKEAVGFLRKADAVKPGQPELRLALAQVLAADNQWEESEKVAKQLLAEKKDYVGTYDFLFLQYMQRGRRPDAEQILKDRSAAFPKVANYQLGLAAFYWGTNRKPEAEQILNSMLGNKGDFPDARMAAGDFYLRTREWDKALKNYDEGVAENGKNKTAYRIKSILALASSNKMEDALGRADQLVKDEPKNDDALQLRASLILQAGNLRGNEQRVQAAINDLQALLGRNPNNPAVRFNLGRAYQGRGEMAPARVQYQEAVKLRPDFIAAQIGLGQVLLAVNEDARALQTADEILRLDPSNLAGRVIRNGALMKTGNLAQARADLSNAIKLRPNEPQLTYQLALLDARERRFKEAETGLASLRQQFPNDRRLLFALTEISLQTGKSDVAFKMLEDELKKDGSRDDVRMALAMASLRTNNLDKAASEFRSLIEKNPKNMDLYLRLSDTLRLKGDRTGSLDAIRKAHSLQPASAVTNLQMAMTLEFADQRDQAKPYYETVLKTEPDNAIALNNLAFMMAEEGRDLDQALTYAQRAKQKLPNNDDVADTLGWIYIKKNLSDNAVQIFRELTTKQPKNATFHYHLGMALFQKGDRPSAKQSLQTALSLKPPKTEEPKIRELLAKVS